MPWKETCTMKERMQLISLYETGKYTMTELARSFKVSRKTVHKWVARFKEDGISGLGDHSRAPYRRPRATPTFVVAALLRAKHAHPTWGPGKLFPMPGEGPEVVQAWPVVSTRGRLLALNGLVSPRRRRRRITPWSRPFLEADKPNAVWCADFKGYIRAGNGSRCDPLTITDSFSRMFLCCEILPRPDHDHARPVFERVFREYGLPLAIRTDNGQPFASVGVGGLSQLSAWWVKLGILPERIEPGHPEQNGRHERMHRTLKQDTMCPPAATPEAQQQRCDEFRVMYNVERPHEALGQVPPASRFVSSPRPYPNRLGDLEYPPLTEVRRVRSNGQIKWRGRLVFISESLVGELVGITEHKDGWYVSFGPIPLGQLRTNCNSLAPFPPDHPSHSNRKTVTHVFS